MNSVGDITGCGVLGPDTNSPADCVFLAKGPAGGRARLAVA